MYRRLNSGPDAREIIRKAYDFALNHVGQDKDSGDIWTAYIQFLRSGEVCDTYFSELARQVPASSCFYWRKSIFFCICPSDRVIRRRVRV